MENGFDDLDDLVRYPADELEDMMETLTAHGVKRPHANKLRRALENAKAAAGGGGGAGAHRHRGDGPPVSPGSGGPDLWQQAEAGMLALGAGLMGAKPTDLSALRGKGGAGAAARFDALDFARYAASCHIVLGHFYQRFAIRGVEYVGTMLLLLPILLLLLPGCATTAPSVTALPPTYYRYSYSTPAAALITRRLSLSGTTGRRSPGGASRGTRSSSSRPGSSLPCSGSARTTRPRCSRCTCS